MHGSVKLGIGVYTDRARDVIKIAIQAGWQPRIDNPEKFINKTLSFNYRTDTSADWVIAMNKGDFSENLLL